MVDLETRINRAHPSPEEAGNEHADLSSDGVRVSVAVSLAEKSVGVHEYLMVRTRFPTHEFCVQKQSPTSRLRGDRHMDPQPNISLQFLGIISCDFGNGQRKCICLSITAVCSDTSLSRGLMGYPCRLMKIPARGASSDGKLNH